ncbi:MAG: YIP1 family protein [Caldilineaceae bacterium]|nr:YIP1 family protein [Caldilineaceae bacterium]MDE0463834.1 YIP1 family protein [Caldilineaceae bacterium]
MTIDLRSMFQTWVKVLTKPGVDVFEAERLKPSATLATALVWIVLAGAVTTLLELLHARLYPSFSMNMWPFSSLMPSEFLAAWKEMPARSQIQILSGVLTAPIVFIISVGIQHLIASQLGMDRIRLEPSGEKRLGRFGRYAYLNATFGAPLSIITLLLDFVPLLNCIASLILAIYQFVLAYFATRAEYRLPRGRVIFVILVGPIFVGGGCGLLSGVLYNSGIGS